MFIYLRKIDKKVKTIGILVITTIYHNLTFFIIVLVMAIIFCYSNFTKQNDGFIL